MKTGPGPSLEPLETDAPETTTEDEGWLRCVACESRIARETAAIAVNGKRSHEFMNPSGLRFIVSCFSAAPGCAPEGERSAVWTWFPGFAWQIEVCRACRSHLGWSFHAATTFYGLISDRLH